MYINAVMHSTGKLQSFWMWCISLATALLCVCTPYSNNYNQYLEVFVTSFYVKSQVLNYMLSYPRKLLLYIFYISAPILIIKQGILHILVNVLLLLLSLCPMTYFYIVSRNGLSLVFRQHTRFYPFTSECC